MKTIFLFFKTPRILLSFATLLTAAAVVIGATFAFFSDTETSAGNTLEAGEIDLRIDNTSYLNHATSSATTWQLKDDSLCTGPGSPGDSNPFDGELGSLLNFVFWTDDGDNVLETDEPVIASGSAKDVLDSDIILADSTTNNLGGANGEPLIGGETYHIGKAWCFGTLLQNPVLEGLGDSPIVNSGILCDGSGINNASQTDSVM